MFPIKYERGGVGLSGLTLEALDLPRAALRQELFGLRLAYPLARDVLPYGELAAVFPDRAAVSL